MTWTLIILALLIAYLILAYNSLISKRNRVKNSWSQIDVQLKRRYDLIPNLVNTVKGYLKHEREVLEKVTQARTLAMSARGVRDTAEKNNQLTQTLRSLFAVAENYPDLKANQNMLALQEELTSTENKISFARQHFNDCVLRLNNAIQAFPSNIVARLFAFKEEEFFEVEAPEEKKNIKVDFGT